MTGPDDKRDVAELWELEQALHTHRRDREIAAQPLPSDLTGPSWRLRMSPAYWRLVLMPWMPLMRRGAIVGGGLLGVAAISVGLLWWRLASGPISLDVATPWLAAAIEENFGSRHRVEVGGTQIERDALGNTALRIRDIVVRDADGTVVASAPKAEVGISGLLSGRLRAERLSLVGAEMSLRIETDGRVTVFAGTDSRPIASASPEQAPAAMPRALVQRRGAVVSPDGGLMPGIAALLTWMDGLRATGLDGHDLAELGLKNGSLIIDDRRNQERWTFDGIDVSLKRLADGGVQCSIGSAVGERPWSLRAVVTPLADGRRVIDIDAERLSTKDLLLIAFSNRRPFDADIPVSMRLRAQLEADGTLAAVQGQMLAGPGTLGDPQFPRHLVSIDRFEANFNWDQSRGALMVPFQIQGGGNRFTLLARLEMPTDPGGDWGLSISGGTVVLAAKSGAPRRTLVLSRFLLGMRHDSDKQRIELVKGDIGNADLGLALSGHLDYSSGETRLVLGVAATRMPVGAFKLIWPGFVAPNVREWVEKNLDNGSVERLVVAINAPWASLKRGSAARLEDDNLSVELVAKNTDVRPTEGVPVIRGTGVTARVTGSKASVNFDRGNLVLNSGRTLAFAGGVFEVPDIYDWFARTRFRLEGPVSAASELIGGSWLRRSQSAPLDLGASRGTIAANIVMEVPLLKGMEDRIKYAVEADVSNFIADAALLGEKFEAAALSVTADTEGYAIKGDAKISGVVGRFDYRMPYATGQADVKIEATLNGAARERLGFNLGSALVGDIVVRAAGRLPEKGGDSNFAIEADLTPAKIDNLLPGWAKVAGRPTRVTFNLRTGNKLSRAEDLVVTGAGVLVKGMVVLDADGKLSSAEFPVFSVSEGDKASLTATRATNGRLKVTMRGELFDGRQFIQSQLAGSSDDDSKSDSLGAEVDLDIKLDTALGFHGETLRGVDLKMSRRDGVIRGLTLSAKLGSTGRLIGDLRGQPGGREVIYLEASDAGAFFRFVNTYGKIIGGEMWVAVDPHSSERSPQNGILNVRDFIVRGEPTLDRVVAGAARGQTAAPANVEFNRLRVDFVRTGGRLTIRDGVVRGPVVGATIKGVIDYRADQVSLNGTFVPLYGLNNMFGQIPIVGLFLGGGQNEGLVGVTYEVVGRPSAPVLRVNLMSAVAPGVLRKFFEFPGANSYTREPTR